MIEVIRPRSSLYWDVARAAFDIANAENALESCACEVRITFRIERSDGTVFERDMQLDKRGEWHPYVGEASDAR